MAQLGDLSTIEVGEFKFAIRMTWGKLRAILRQLSAASDDNAEAAFDAMTAALQDTIVGVEGLTDAEGNALAWQPEMVDDLSPLQVKTVFEQLINISVPARETDAPGPLGAITATPGP